MLIHRKIILTSLVKPTFFSICLRIDHTDLFALFLRKLPSTVLIIQLYNSTLCPTYNFAVTVLKLNNKNQQNTINFFSFLPETYQFCLKNLINILKMPNDNQLFNFVYFFFQKWAELYTSFWNINVKFSLASVTRIFALYMDLIFYPNGFELCLQEK